MTDETQLTAEDFSDSIRRALQAAAVATDAAEEAASISDQSRKAIAAAAAGQRRMTYIAAGTLVGAFVAAGLGALVYLRSVADLREAAELQAIANKALVEQIQALERTKEDAIIVISELTTFEDRIKELIDGIATRIKTDMDAMTADSAALQPQMATAIQDHFDAGLEKMRAEVMTSLAALELGGTGAGDPEMKVLLTDLRDMLANGLPPAEAKPATPPKKAETKTASPKPKQTATPAKKPAPKPAKPPFSFP